MSDGLAFVFCCLKNIDYCERLV